MKKIFTLIFVINVFFANGQNGLLNGTGFAPDFTVTDLNGSPHNLYDYLDSGYVVVLDFLSITCGHCIMHTPGIINSYATNGPNGNNTARHFCSTQSFNVREWNFLLPGGSISCPL